MLDIAVAYNRYKFLGDEFLTWLFYIMENEREKLKDKDQNPLSLELGNRIVFENTQQGSKVESITIKGEDLDLKEGLVALQKGAFVTEVNLVLKEDENEWRFSIKGESFNISTLKTPETGKVEKKEDMEGAILEKVYLQNRVIEFMDHLFLQFIRLRISPKWDSEVIPLIKTWITT